MTKVRVLATLKYICLTAIVCIVAILSARFISNVESSYPYPYKVNKIKRSEVAKASVADFLIIGGTQAVNLTPHMKQFLSETSKDLKKPLNLYNWASANEPMGITLNKIKALKKLPMITLYLGGSNEFDTSRFKISEVRKIIANLKRTEDDTLMTAMLTVPMLSRFIYTPIDKAILGQTKDVDAAKLPDKAVKHLLKLNYTIYENEVAELLNIFKLKDASIWVAPAALNINTLPIKTCDYTETQETFDQRKTINEYLKKGRLKEAKNLAINLVSTKTPNANNYYTLGITLLRTGDYEKARSALYQARMFDCGLSYSTPIHLKILMEQAEKRGYTIIDFNRMVLNQLGRNQLFFAEQQPQNIFYEQFIQELLQEFKLYLER